MKQLDIVIEALENLKGALEQAKPYIDEANGYFENVLGEVATAEKSKEITLSEYGNEKLLEIEDFYREFPTWDSIDEVINRIKSLEKEVVK